ncbi:hypothetical protein BD779DRAFT_1134734 [Infundibulicybe gibba]|nr:hypothetical protein BD779DRAFT_1134734 [Infundibulicybe gibba]
MTLIHNTFIRGLNSIHEKAGLVRPADVPAFMGYITSLTTAIHEHHHGEETIIFPFLQTKLDKMKDNLKQHERFSGGVNELENYAKRVSVKKEQYDAQKVKSLIEAFGSDIVEHLGDEIPTVAPEELAKFEKADLDAMVEVHEKHIKQQPVFTVFPFVLTHHDASAVPQWPPLPSAISWFARNIAYRVHSSYWKFSPFDNHGLPHAAYA